MKNVQKNRKMTLTKILLFSIGLASSIACNQQKSHTLDSIMGTENIVGGDPVTDTDQIGQHVVALETGLQVFCTGVLVKKNVVLTAAHCTDVASDPRYINVVFGKDVKGEVQKRRVLGGKVTDKWPALTTHDLINPSSPWGDLALLKFEGEAPEGFTPARILGNAEKLTEGLEITLAGYGLTKMPDTESTKLLKTSVRLTNPTYTESELLFAQFEGRGACHGDSGGPAFANFNGKIFLVGITSRSATATGAETCLEGSIYTSVAKQLPFLIESAKFLDSSKFVAGEKIPQPNF